MNVYQVIKHLHPQLKAERDFVLRDDGEGAYILRWNVEIPEPTEEELAQAWEAIKSEQPPLSEVEAVKKEMTDLVYELMMKGVL